MALMGTTSPLSPQVPYDVGFNPPEDIVITVVEYIIDIIFVIDIVGCFFTAIVDSSARLITGAAAGRPRRRLADFTRSWPNHVGYRGFTAAGIQFCSVKKHQCAFRPPDTCRFSRLALPPFLPVTPVVPRPPNADQKTISHTYLRGWFGLDVLAVFPFELIITTIDAGTTGGTDGKNLRLIAFIKAPRLLRLSKVLRYLDRLGNATLIKILRLFFLFCFITHVAACGFHLMETSQAASGTQMSWMKLQTVRADDFSSSMFRCLRRADRSLRRRPESQPTACGRLLRLTSPRRILPPPPLVLRRPMATYQ